MTSLNFDDDGQLGSMELYSLQLQKIVADFTEFDAVTKAYVDDKVAQAKSELTDGASDALNTFKELEEYLEGSDTASGLVDQISALSAQIAAEVSRAQGAESTITANVTAEVSRATTAEGGLATRIAALETDATTGADVSAVQTELDTTQQGAGLDLDGSYVADAARNYVSTATSLKSADALLDSALKTEADRATAAEEKLTADLNNQISAYNSNKTTTDSNTTTLRSDVDANLFSFETEKKQSGVDRAAIRTEFAGADTALSNRIATLEADPTTATAVANEIKDRTTADNALSGRIATLEADPTTAAAVAGETTARTAADTALSGRISTLEADPTTATAVAGETTARTAADTALSGRIATLEADPTTATAVAGETTARTAADNALSGRVAVFEGQLNNGNVEGSEFYVDNLSVQGVVDDLRGAIDYVNGERFSNTNDIAELETKRIASDVRHASHEAKQAAHDTKHASHEENIGELETGKFDKAGGAITGEVRVNLDASYFYLSPVWRIKTDAIGKRIVIEYNKGSEEEPDFVSGIPFISSH